MGIFNFLERTIKLNSADADTVYINIPAELYYKELAIYNAVSLIGNAIARCNIETYIENKKVKKADNYILNVSPNPNQTSGQFWRKVVWKMLGDSSAHGKCVCVEYKNNLYVVDNYHIDTIDDIDGHIYSNLAIGDTTLNGKYTSDDLIIFQSDQKSVRDLLDNVGNEYSKVLSNAVQAFRAGNGKKYKLKIDAAEAGSPGFAKKFSDDVQKKLETFLSAENAVYPEFEGYELISAPGDAKNATSTDLINIRKDMFDFVSSAYKIPLALMTGTATNMDVVIEQFLTFSVDPVADIITDGLNKSAGYVNYAAGSYYRVNTNAINHRDPMKLSNSIDKLISSGVCSVNDILTLMGEATIDEDWANQHWMTKNYSKIDDVANGITS